MTPNTTKGANDERAALLTEAGELILTSAFLRYLAPLSESEQAAFETYVAHHGQEDDFIDTLVVVYPDFAPILDAEIAAFLVKKETDIVL